MIKYEWSLETVDSFGDIVDSTFEDRLCDLEGDGELVLVRNDGNEIDGVTDRYWAYVVDGKLPEYFSGANGQTGIKVPKKFISEFNKLKVTEL